MSSKFRKSSNPQYYLQHRWVKSHSHTYTQTHTCLVVSSARTHTRTTATDRGSRHTEPDRAAAASMRARSTLAPAIVHAGRKCSSLGYNSPGFDPHGFAALSLSSPRIFRVFMCLLISSAPLLSRFLVDCVFVAVSRRCSSLLASVVRFVHTDFYIWPFTWFYFTTKISTAVLSDWIYFRNQLHRSYIIRQPSGKLINQSSTKKTCLYLLIYIGT